MDAAPEHRLEMDQFCSTLGNLGSVDWGRLRSVLPLLAGGARLCRCRRLW
jgi:hypothetical protein